MPTPPKPMLGLRFGALQVLALTPHRSTCGTAIYLCQCDCGENVMADGVNLRRATTTSCGCLTRDKQVANGKTAHRTHGASSSGLRHGSYLSWVTMKRRCLDPNYKDYAYYGGAGIEVCHEWLDFEKFYADMGPRPEGMTLDREDHTQGYSYTNCRWATHTTQMNNTSRNRWITYEGETHTVAEWARILSVPRARLSARINGLGWSIEKAFKGK